MKEPLVYIRTQTPPVVIDGVEWFEYDYPSGGVIHWIGNVEGDITVGPMDPSTRWAGQWYANIFESTVTEGAYTTTVTAGTTWDGHYPDRDTAMRATIAEYTRRGGK